MTTVAFALNALLVFLLLAAMMVGFRLERRLRGLRDSHAGFAQAALDLNAAIARAETGLADMRTALTDAEETLTERVDEARAAARKLEAAMRGVRELPHQFRDAPQTVAAPPARPAPQPLAAQTQDDIDALPIKDLLARLRGALPIEDRGQAEVLNLRERTAPLAPPLAARSRARVDDDLFDLDIPPMRRAGQAR
jgi:uncharacterized protein DUF6468